MSKGTISEQAAAAASMHWAIIEYLIINGVPEEVAAGVAENHGGSIDNFINNYYEERNRL